jgi:hypothetical protein
VLDPPCVWANSPLKNPLLVPKEKLSAVTSIPPVRIRSVSQIISMRTPPKGRQLTEDGTRIMLVPAWKSTAPEPGVAPSVRKSASVRFTGWPWLRRLGEWSKMTPGVPA